jgi:1,4-alpha-glucan branching enzyme
MKKIIQPKKEEKAEYFSDFSDKSFGIFHPDVEIKFEFNYGSKFDGGKVEFHLTDQEAEHVLDFIRMNLSEGKIIELKNRLKSAEEDYEDNVNARDWQSCDYYYNCIELYRYLLPND